MRLPHVCTIQKRTPGATDGYGEPGAPTWADDQTAVACRFYEPREDALRAVTGEARRLTPKVILPPTVTIARETYRITTAQVGYAGTYGIDAITPRQNGPGDVHHYTVELQVIQS